MAISAACRAMARWLQLQRLDDGSVQLDNRAEGYALRIESIDMAGPDR